MQIFAVIAPEPNSSLRDAVLKAFPGRNFEVAAGQFLVSTNAATTQQVNEMIGLPGGRLGRAMVLHVVNWNGWHDKNIWEWMTAQSNESPGLGALGGG